MEYTYKITGNITYNEAETEDGFDTVEIEEYITINEMSAEKALEIFLAENEQFDFSGHSKHAMLKQEVVRVLHFWIATKIRHLMFT